LWHKVSFRGAEVRGQRAAPWMNVRCPGEAYLLPSLSPSPLLGSPDHPSTYLHRRDHPRAPTVKNLLNMNLVFEEKKKTLVIATTYFLGENTS
jgi:hypothetical protein